MRKWMLTEPIVVIISLYVNQPIMFYALNLYSDVCQLCLDKTRGEGGIEKQHAK